MWHRLCLVTLVLASLALSVRAAGQPPDVRAFKMDLKLRAYSVTRWLPVSASQSRLVRRSGIAGVERADLLSRFTKEFPDVEWQVVASVRTERELQTILKGEGEKLHAPMVILCEGRLHVVAWPKVHDRAAELIKRWDEEAKATPAAAPPKEKPPGGTPPAAEATGQALPVQPGKVAVRAQEAPVVRAEALESRFYDMRDQLAWPQAAEHDDDDDDNDDNDNDHFFDREADPPAQWLLTEVLFLLTGEPLWDSTGVGRRGDDKAARVAVGNLGHARPETSFVWFDRDLMVKTSPAMHALLERRLAALRRAVEMQVFVEVRLVRGKRKVIERVVGKDVGTTRPLSDEQWNELFKIVKASPEVKVIQAPSLLVPDGERHRISLTTPVVPGGPRRGVWVTYLPTMSPDGSRVLVKGECRMTTARSVKPKPDAKGSDVDMETTFYRLDHLVERGIHYVAGSKAQLRDDPESYELLLLRATPMAPEAIQCRRPVD